MFLKEILGYLKSSPTPDPRRGTGEQSCMNGINQRINSLVSVISYQKAIMLIPEGVKRCVYGFYTMINKDEYVLPIYGIILIGCYGLNAILPAPQQLVADLGLLLGRFKTASWSHLGPYH